MWKCFDFIRSHGFLSSIERLSNFFHGGSCRKGNTKKKKKVHHGDDGFFFALKVVRARDYVMDELVVKQEHDSDEFHSGDPTGGDENGGSDQEIVVGIDEDHINFLTSMASGDDDSLDGPPEIDGVGGRINIKQEHEQEDDEDVMAAAESILSRTAERTQQQIYHCKYCNKTFTWLKSLTVHLRTHTNVKPYKCELCDRSFVRSDYLKYHIIKSHETTEQVFTCTACSGVFATNRGLLRHIRTEHYGKMDRKENYAAHPDYPSESESYYGVDENGKYACTYCDECYDARDLLLQHIKRHLGDKPFRCDICSKSFIRQDFLQCHRSNHLKSLDFKRKGFPLEAAKRPRIGLKKLEDLIQSNSVSRAESSDDEGAEQVVSSSDSEEEQPNLGQETEEQKCMVAALLTEVTKTERGKLQCPRCEKAFSKETSLKVHLRSHTGITPFKCPLCSLAFMRQDFLKNHLKKHIEDNGEDPGALGAIDTSNLSFSTAPFVSTTVTSSSTAAPSISLLKPLSARPQSTGISLLKPPEERKPPDQQEYCIRTEDGKFMCTACERVFSHQQTVRIHYRIHTNEKPYKCNHCSESFIRSDYLERHMKIHWKDGNPMSILPPVMPKGSFSGIGTSDSNDSMSPQKPTIGRAGLLPENYHFVDAGDGQYACKICDQVFNHSDSLRKHALTHTEEKPFFCDVCDRSFNRVDYLKEHFKSKRHRQALAEANGEILDDDDDSTTDMSYTSRMAKTKSPISPMTNALADRIEFQKTDDGRYKCSECDKTFVTAVTLKMHLRLHTGEKPYKCDRCEMAFIRSDYLKTHEKIHRQEEFMKRRQMMGEEHYLSEDASNDGLGQQNEPDSNFHGMLNMKEEPDLDTDEPQAEDGEVNGEDEQDDDDEESEDEQVIEVMVKEEDSDDEEDDDDDEEEDEQEGAEERDFKNEEEAKEEENENNNSYEHEEDNISRASESVNSEPLGPKSKHRCNICKKEFAWPKSLKIHLRTHTGERPYECDVCGKSFTRSDSLKAHRNTHGDVRVLQCHLCEATFLSDSGLIQHQHEEHGIEPLDGY